MVKCTCCSYRGPGFHFQCSYGGSQLSATPVSEYSTPFLVCVGSRPTHDSFKYICEGKTHKHKIIIILKKENCPGIGPKRSLVELGFLS